MKILVKIIHKEMVFYNFFYVYKKEKNLTKSKKKGKTLTEILTQK